MNFLHFLFLFLLLTSCFRIPSSVPEDMSIKVRKVAKMPKELGECSGLIYRNGKIIANNDGGNDPYLFVMDTSNISSIYSKILIENTENKDWEAITSYKDEILIGDFGNNLGRRKDLKIYHIDADNYQLKHTVSFKYPDQVDFSNPKHNFDCEAMIVKDDRYFLFTKNRGNQKTNIYSAPINGNNFTLLDSIPLPGMVTDAYYHRESNQILLLFYKFVFGGFKNGLAIIKSKDNNTFEVSGIFNIKPAEQIESITHFDGNKFLIGSETGIGNGRHLYIVTIEGF